MRLASVTQDNVSAFVSSDLTLTPSAIANKQEDDSYMNDAQQDYFRQKLLSWRSQLLDSSSQTINQMQDSTSKEADEIDMASNTVNQSIELRTRDRERKLINKIDEALRRIEEGNYGYCEETGEPIGFRRLDARPIATLSIDAQERRERLERLQRDY